MNRLPLAKRCQIIQLLVEGNSLRSCSRIADVSLTTVIKLLVDVGQACINFHDQTIVQIKSQRIQCDEMWSFVYSKEKNTPEGETGKGSVWVWIAMDADTKLIISWLVGERNENFAHAFMKDLASRLKGETQITTDGYSHYTGAINAAFDTHVDFAQLVKQYSRAKTGEVHNNNETGNGGRYIGAKKVIMFGQPNPKFISTSYIERQNLTVRMCSRRFTRKTNAFSKKVENHGYALALNFVYYNFVRIHRSLRITPAMQAGLCKKPMTFADIATLA